MGLVTPKGEGLRRARFARIVENAKKLINPEDPSTLESNLIKNLIEEEIQLIECSTQGNDPIFDGATGNIFSVKCPSDCNNEKGKVFGT